MLIRAPPANSQASAIICSRERLRFPAETGCCAISGGDQSGRVAGPAGSDRHGQRAPGHLFDGGQYFPDAEPVAVAEVADQVFTRLGGGEREHMRPGQVGDVHIVADRCAVRRRPVVAVDGQRVSTTGRRRPAR